MGEETWEPEKGAQREERERERERERDTGTGYVARACSCGPFQRSSSQEKKIPVSVMLAHWLTANTPFEWHEGFAIYWPIGEGQEVRVYDYLGYVDKIKSDLQIHGLWDRIHVSNAMAMALMC